MCIFYDLLLVQNKNVGPLFRNHHTFQKGGSGALNQLRAPCGGPGCAPMTTASCGRSLLGTLWGVAFSLRVRGQAHRAWTSWASDGVRSLSLIQRCSLWSETSHCPQPQQGCPEMQIPGPPKPAGCALGSLPSEPSQLQLLQSGEPSHCRSLAWFYSLWGGGWGVRLGPHAVDCGLNFSFSPSPIAPSLA